MTHTNEKPNAVRRIARRGYKKVDDPIQMTAFVLDHTCSNRFNRDLAALLLKEAVRLRVENRILRNKYRKVVHLLIDEIE